MPNRSFGKSNPAKSFDSGAVGDDILSERIGIEGGEYEQRYENRPDGLVHGVGSGSGWLQIVYYAEPGRMIARWERNSPRISAFQVNCRKPWWLPIRLGARRQWV